MGESRKQGLDGTGMRWPLRSFPTKAIPGQNIKLQINSKASVSLGLIVF